MRREMIYNIEIILHFSNFFGFHSDKCFCFLPTHWRGKTKILLEICSNFNPHTWDQIKNFFFLENVLWKPFIFNQWRIQSYLLMEKPFPDSHLIKEEGQLHFSHRLPAICLKCFLQQ